MTGTPKRVISWAGASALVLAMAAGAQAAPPAGNGHGNSHGHAHQGGTAPGGTSDPRGNNGTIKIDGVPFDGGHGNDAHVGCQFAVTFWGFDRNQTADITFTGQAPTRSAGPLLSEHNVLISTTPARGGRYDGARYYTADQLHLTGIAPAHQGWHVRVSVDVAGAPGGAKTKVFWIRCAQPASGGTTSAGSGSAAPAAAGATATGFTGGGLTAVRTGSAGQVRSATAAGAAAPARAGFTGGSATAVLTQPARTAAEAGPFGLPFTGLPLLALLLLAAGLLVAGALSLRAGRRRTAVSL